MTTHPLYPQGRASALPSASGEHPAPTDYELVKRLRYVRADGDEAMTAVEEFDPDFSLKLSACGDPAAADALLADWLRHRTEVLERTQRRLRETWQHGIAARAAREAPDGGSSA